MGQYQVLQRDRAQRPLCGQLRLLDAFWEVDQEGGLVAPMPRFDYLTRPGLVPAGDWIPTLCGVWIRIRCGTPYEQQPRSKSIDERCPDCERIAAEDQSSAVNWDF